MKEILKLKNLKKHFPVKNSWGTDVALVKALDGVNLKQTEIFAKSSGIPVIALPTFGALIISKEPLVNRDALFDLGISGPIAGLLVTIIVAIMIYCFLF